MVILGILILLLSIFVLLNPFSAGVVTILVVAGAGLIVLGVTFCMVAAKLKEIKREFAAE
jgi:uncharacterized membrane protein HdeD (DUF308 family)